jgi:protein-S-isoprenylcysteine O-methyltransferase Ste14
MKIFEIIANTFVILSLVYVSFVLTLADWLAGLRKGQAVSLLPERNGRNYPIWAQVGLVFLGLAIFAAMVWLLWIPLLFLPNPTLQFLAVLGLILYAAGCIFMLWARRSLGKMWGISTSQQVKLYDDHQIVQSGPYAFVRNPMYFGWIVAMFGLILLYPVWVVILMFLFSLVAFTGRARREDAAMAGRFGEAWTGYKKRTKFLIPFIY